MMKFESRIKIRMFQKGVTGAEIARRQCVHRTAIYHVIAGRSKSKRLRLAIERALEEIYWPDNNTHKKAG